MMRIISLGFGFKVKPEGFWKIKGNYHKVAVEAVPHESHISLRLYLFRVVFVLIVGFDYFPMKIKDE